MADFELSGLLELDATDYVGGVEEAGAASEDMADGAGEAEESLFDLEPAGIAAGAALAGVGTAAQDVLDDTQSMREELAIASVTLGESSDSVENLATELSNATLPTEDASGAIANLAQAGVESEERMRDLVPAFDAIADATGSSATDASELGGVLRALDGDFSAAEEDADAFVAAANRTQLSLSEVISTIERVDFENLEEMGVQSADAAALVALFGRETGLTGRRLRSEFRQAVDEADGSMADLVDELGLSQEEFEEFQEETATGTELTEEYADQANETVDASDGLSTAIDDLQLQFASVLQPVSAAAPALQGLGIALLGVSTINFTAVVPSFAAVSAAALPVTAAILAIGAAVTAAAVIWKRDIGGIQDKAKALKETVSAAIGGVVDLVQEGFDKLTYILFEWDPMETLGDVKDAMLGALPTAQDFLEKGEALIDALIQGVRNKIDGVGDAVGDVADTASDFLPGSDAERGALSTLTDQAAALPETFEQETRAGADGVGDAAGEMAASASEGARPSGDGSGGSDNREEIVFSFEADTPLEQMLWDALEPQRKREARRAINRGVRQ